MKTVVLGPSECLKHQLHLVADCGSKKCNNGGTLNPETCECECKKIFSGPSCDERKFLFEKVAYYIFH